MCLEHVHNAILDKSENPYNPQIIFTNSFLIKSRFLLQDKKFRLSFYISKIINIKVDVKLYINEFIFV